MAYAMVTKCERECDRETERDNKEEGLREKRDMNPSDSNRESVARVTERKRDRDREGERAAIPTL